jgi:hypothetical protein
MPDTPPMHTAHLPRFCPSSWCCRLADVQVLPPSAVISTRTMPLPL